MALQDWVGPIFINTFSSVNVEKKRNRKKFKEKTFSLNEKPSKKQNFTASMSTLFLENYFALFHCIYAWSLEAETSSPHRSRSRGGKP